MDASTIIATIRQKFELLRPVMTERMRRQWAASEALSLAPGRHDSRRPSHRHVPDHHLGRRARASAIRRRHLRLRVIPVGVGGPAADGIWPRWMTPACSRTWNAWSTRPRGAIPCRRYGGPVRARASSPRSCDAKAIDVSHQTVALLLHAAGYSLQSNRKTREGGSHPDRNAQFEFINARVLALQKRGQPVVSVDTKKKELIGDFKNNGEEWQPGGSARGGARQGLPGQAVGQGDPLRGL